MFCLRISTRPLKSPAFLLLALLVGPTPPSAVSEEPEPTAGELVQQLQDANVHIRRKAAHALVNRNNSEAIDALGESLKDDDTWVRLYSTEALAKRNNDKTIDPLIVALKDIDVRVRRTSAQALARLDDARTVDPLISALQDDDTWVSHPAAAALSKRDDPRVEKAFAESLLSHRDRFIRAVAARYFVDHTPPNTLAILTQAIRDEDAGIRVDVIKALEKLEDQATLTPLLSVLHDKESTVLTAAVAALAARPDVEIDKLYRELLVAPSDPIVRRAAAVRILKHPEKADVPLLVQALRDTDVAVRQAAVQSLGQLAELSTLDPLLEMLTDSGPNIASHAAQSLKAVIVAHPPNEPGTRARWLSYVLEGLSELRRPHLAAHSPTIELVGGESLVGKLKGFATVTIEQDRPLNCLVVETAGAVRSANESGATMIRIDARWLRRIVCEAKAPRAYQPGTAWGLDGAAFAFRKIRWTERGVSLLGENDLRSFGFADLSELHLPVTNRWDAYVTQLASADHRKPSRLLYLETIDRNRLVIPADRFQVFAAISSHSPTDWGHSGTPLWSLDPLIVPHSQAFLVANVPITQVPLAWQDPDTENQHSVIGGKLARWGIGTMADSTLEFAIPPFAEAFSVRVGLDRIARDGGCAKALVVAGLHDDRSESLFQSPLLIGSSTVHNAGLLPIPRDAKVIKLIANSAHQDRPTGADPFNIRDFVDWIEPSVILGAGALEAAIAATHQTIEETTFLGDAAHAWKVAEYPADDGMRTNLHHGGDAAANQPAVANRN